MSERLDQVRDLAGRGFSASQIARATGSTRNAIAGLCHRNGIKLRGVCKIPTASCLYFGARSKFRDGWLLDDGSDA